MKGLTLNTTADKSELIATVDPLLFGPNLDRDAFLNFVSNSEYSAFSVSENALLLLSDEITAAASSNAMAPITQKIGQVKPAKVIVAISSNQMEASVTIERPITGVLPTVDNIVKELHAMGVVRGVGKKKIRNLIQVASDAAPGSEHTDVVAKGLLPKSGKNSYIKPLVPNAIDRVLAPTAFGNDKVDMRNLGDVLCVKQQQSIARRMPPGTGRIGYTVTDKKLKPAAGEWKEIKLGANTELAKNDENTIIASLAGQPKFENDKMSVDDTYVSKGVNVGTGNIKYEGAVIINGDVTENMQVIAEGDVTINGFVESALIRSGGDIIITQGATGKMNDEDCQLFASGSIFIQHGQGLDVIAGKDLNVAKQLAYSRVKCRGSVTVGSIDNPMGNLFASTISCFTSVKAGSVGAVSGSVLTIDFSEGFNILTSRLDALSELFKTLSSSNADHEVKIAALSSKHIPQALKNKMASLTNELDSERLLLNWLRLAKQEMQHKKDEYEQHARVVANKELFPGVMVKLNKKMWKGEKECQRCRIILENGNWLYDPMV